MAQQRRPFRAEDILRVRTVSDPQVAPDGSCIAYVVAETDREADEFRSHVWIAPLDGGEPYQLTRGPHKDGSPRWSPDGKTLAFVSNRAAEGEKNGDNTKRPSQIWLIGERGEPRRLTNAARGAGSPAWSPDGTTIAFVTKTRLAGETKSEAEKTPAEKNAPRVIRDLIYRFDTEGQYDDTYAHLWTVPAAGGEAIQITRGDFRDAEPQWSRDGRRFVFLSNHEEDRGARLTKDVWSVDARAGGGNERKLTQSRGPCTMPAVSPDGRTVAYAGHAKGEGYSAANTLLWSVPLDGSAPPRALNEALDRGAFGLPLGKGLAWAPDGSAVYTVVMDGGASRLYRIAADGSGSRPLSDAESAVTALCPTPDGKAIAYTAVSPTNPGELFLLPLDGGAARQLSRHNAELLDEVQLQPFERISFSGADGWEIAAWLLKPANYDASRRYPLVLDVHGGPHGAHGYTFQPGAQELTARGYVVLLVNPRGSTGYGERFTEACVTDWGGKDYEDLMAGVDWAIARGIADPQRTAVTGYSYGGFMTSWVVGHTDRFKAAVCGAPVGDLPSFYGESDIGTTFGAYEHGGPVWERWDAYRERSPLTYIANCTTPFLLLHWEGDLRCPIGQGESLFAVLRRLRREVEFVRYPGGFHTYVTHAPSQRVDAVQRTGDWFGRWLGAAQPANREAEVARATA
ncbi:MAG TPA: S9 family peptidase [Dehalococcoidia bacterium]|nr:S9 family peptidase [Dehalococcoidia bacterium]